MDLAWLDSHAPTSNTAYTSIYHTHPFPHSAAYWPIPSWERNNQTSPKNTKTIMSWHSPTCFFLQPAESPGDFPASFRLKRANRQCAFKHLVTLGEAIWISPNIHEKNNVEFCLNKMKTKQKKHFKQFQTKFNENKSSLNKDNSNKQFRPNKNTVATPEFLLRRCARFPIIFGHWQKNPTLWLTESGCHRLQLRPFCATKSQKSSDKICATYVNNKACQPRTQMTPVLIGKGLVLGGLTFTNRGHWGSRSIYSVNYKHPVTCNT